MEANNQNIERRNFTGNIERRAEDNKESRTIRGYAALFNQETDLGWFRESIAPGAFDKAIKRSDTRALFNHDANALLARTGSGTLALGVDEKGLWYEFDAPNTTLGNDVLELLERGDLSQSSFGFTVTETGQEIKTEQRDGEHVQVRTITEVDYLFDVSCVTFPAYENTTVAKRFFDLANKKENFNSLKYAERVLRSLSLINY